MASKTIVLEILERWTPFLGRRPTADEFDQVHDLYWREFRGTDAEMLAAGVEQWFSNQPADRTPQTFPRPSQIWPLINRENSNRRNDPEAPTRRFVPMPDNVREQMRLLSTAWSPTASPELRANAAGQIRELAAGPDVMEQARQGRACRCIGGWIYEGAQTYPVDGLLCERRVYPCQKHNPVAFDRWLSDIHGDDEAAA